MLRKMDLDTVIREQLGERPYSRAHAIRAVNRMRRVGWVVNHIPSAGGCHMIVASHDDPLADIYRALDDRGCGKVARDLVASRIRFPVSGAGGYLMLSRYGLALIAVEGKNVVLRGTTPSMAGVVNLSRLRVDLRWSSFVADCVLGLRADPSQLDDDLRQIVVRKFDEFQVDLPGFMDGLDQIPVKSRWLFPPTEPSSIPRLETKSGTDVSKST